jgi:hypothetical protein
MGLSEDQAKEFASDAIRSWDAGKDVAGGLATLGGLGLMAKKIYNRLPISQPASIAGTASATPITSATSSITSSSLKSLLSESILPKGANFVKEGVTDAKGKVCLSMCKWGDG